MPINPVGIYLASGVVIAGTGYAFKKFVYDPHLAPWLEALAIEFLQARGGQHAVRVSGSVGSGSHDNDDGRSRGRGRRDGRPSRPPSGHGHELDVWNAPRDDVCAPLMIDDGPDPAGGAGLSSSVQLRGDASGDGARARRVLGSGKALDERVKAIGVHTLAHQDVGQSHDEPAGSARVAASARSGPSSPSNPPYRPSQHYFPASSSARIAAGPPPDHADLFSSAASPEYAPLDNDLGFGCASEIAASRSLEYSHLSQPRSVGEPAATGMDDSFMSSAFSGGGTSASNPWTLADVENLASHSPSLATLSLSHSASLTHTEHHRASTPSAPFSPYARASSSSGEGTPTSYAGMSPQVAPADMSPHVAYTGLPDPMQPLLLGGGVGSATPSWTRAGTVSVSGREADTGTDSDSWDRGSVGGSVDSWVDAEVQRR